MTLPTTTTCPDWCVEHVDDGGAGWLDPGVVRHSTRVGVFEVVRWSWPDGHFEDTIDVADDLGLPAELCERMLDDLAVASQTLRRHMQSAR